MKRHDIFSNLTILGGHHSGIHGILWEFLKSGKLKAQGIYLGRFSLYVAPIQHITGISKVTWFQLLTSELTEYYIKITTASFERTGIIEMEMN